MANETTSTSWSNITLSESLGAALEAHTADKLVVYNLFNHDSIDGEATLKKSYPFEADDGAASAATEGTDITTNGELTFDSSVDVTPTEGAAKKSTITGRAIKRAQPGYRGADVWAALQAENVDMVTRICMPSARRHVKSVREKLEDDCANLLGSLTNTVGTSGADITIADVINAQYLLRTLEPTDEEWGYVLTPNQLAELQVAFGGASGSAAAVWFQQGDLGFFNHNPDAARNGFKGTIMGIPMYVYSHALRTTANAAADVVGGLVVLGNGLDPYEKRGAFVYVEGDPLRHAVQNDASLRGVELVTVQEYGVALLDDNNGVGIVTDAPV